jgi:hypothetical protein
MKARAFAFAVAFVIASSTVEYGQRPSTSSGYHLCRPLRGLVI